MSNETVKVRVAVVCGHDESGGLKWDSCVEGMEHSGMSAMEAAACWLGEAHGVSADFRYWLTAELPIPQPTEVTAEVESE